MISPSKRVVPKRRSVFEAEAREIYNRFNEQYDKQMDRPNLLLNKDFEKPAVRKSIITRALLLPETDSPNATETNSINNKIEDIPTSTPHPLKHRKFQDFSVLLSPISVTSEQEQGTNGKKPDKSDTVDVVGIDNLSRQSIASPKTRSRRHGTRIKEKEDSDSEPDIQPKLHQTRSRTSKSQEPVASKSKIPLRTKSVEQHRSENSGFQEPIEKNNEAVRSITETDSKRSRREKSRTEQDTNRSKGDATITNEILPEDNRSRKDATLTEDNKSRRDNTTTEQIVYHNKSRRENSRIEQLKQYSANPSEIISISSVDSGNLSQSIRQRKSRDIHKSPSVKKDKVVHATKINENNHSSQENHSIIINEDIVQNEVEEDNSKLNVFKGFTKEKSSKHITQEKEDVDDNISKKPQNTTSKSYRNKKKVVPEDLGDHMDENLYENETKNVPSIISTKSRSKKNSVLEENEDLDNNQPSNKKYSAKKTAAFEENQDLDDKVEKSTQNTTSKRYKSDKKVVNEDLNVGIDENNISKNIQNITHKRNRSKRKSVLEENEEQDENEPKNTHNTISTKRRTKKNSVLETIEDLDDNQPYHNTFSKSCRSKKTSPEENQDLDDKIEKNMQNTLTRPDLTKKKAVPEQNEELDKKARNIQNISTRRDRTKIKGDPDDKLSKNIQSTRKCGRPLKNSISQDALDPDYAPNKSIRSNKKNEHLEDNTMKSIQKNPNKSDTNKEKVGFDEIQHLDDEISKSPNRTSKITRIEKPKPTKSSTTIQVSVEVHTAPKNKNPKTLQTEENPNKVAQSKKSPIEQSLVEEPTHCEVATSPINFANKSVSNNKSPSVDEIALKLAKNKNPKTLPNKLQTGENPNKIPQSKRPLEQSMVGSSPTYCEIATSPINLANKSVLNIINDSVKAPSVYDIAQKRARYTVSKEVQTSTNTTPQIQKSPINRSRINFQHNISTQTEADCGTQTSFQSTKRPDQIQSKNDNQSKHGSLIHSNRDSQSKTSSSVGSSYSNTSGVFSNALQKQQFFQTLRGDLEFPPNFSDSDLEVPSTSNDGPWRLEGIDLPTRTSSNLGIKLGFLQSVRDIEASQRKSQSNNFKNSNFDSDTSSSGAEKTIIAERRKYFRKRSVKFKDGEDEIDDSKKLRVELKSQAKEKAPTASTSTGNLTKKRVIEDSVKIAKIKKRKDMDYSFERQQSIRVCQGSYEDEIENNHLETPVRTSLRSNISSDSVFDKLKESSNRQDHPEDVSEKRSSRKKLVFDESDVIEQPIKKITTDTNTDQVATHIDNIAKVVNNNIVTGKENTPKQSTTSKHVEKSKSNNVLMESDNNARNDDDNDEVNTVRNINSATTEAGKVSKQRGRKKIFKEPAPLAKERPRRKRAAPKEIFKDQLCFVPKTALEKEMFGNKRTSVELILYSAAGPIRNSTKISGQVLLRKKGELNSTVSNKNTKRKKSSKKSQIETKENEEQQDKTPENHIQEMVISSSSNAQIDTIQDPPEVSEVIPLTETQQQIQKPKAKRGRPRKNAVNQNPTVSQKTAEEPFKEPTDRVTGATADYSKQDNNVQIDENVQEVQNTEEMQFDMQEEEARVQQLKDSGFETYRNSNTLFNGTDNTKTSTTITSTMSRPRLRSAAKINPRTSPDRNLRSTFKKSKASKGKSTKKVLVAEVSETHHVDYAPPSEDYMPPSGDIGAPSRDSGAPSGGDCGASSATDDVVNRLTFGTENDIDVTSISKTTWRDSNVRQSLLRTISDGDEITCNFEGKPISYKWVKVPSEGDYRDVNNKFSILKGFQTLDGSATSGFLKMPVGRTKPFEISYDYHIIFVVLEGVASVKLLNKKSIVHPHGSFMVPEGFIYSIQNVSDIPLHMYYTRCRKLDA